MTDDNRTKNEIIKENSRLLRGTIAEGLADVVTGAISEDDSQLTKFHGTYLQDDRDVRPERAKKMLEKAYSFMIRVRLPGGVTTEAMAGARRHRRHLRQSHAAPDDAPDVPVSRRHQVEHEAHDAGDQRRAAGHARRLRRRQPQRSRRRQSVPVEGARRRHELAVEVSEHLLPQTGAYHEIWLDGEQVIDQSARPRRKRSRSTAPTTCRANSRSSSPSRRRTTSTFSHTTSASSPSSRTASSSATTSPSAAAWA